MLERLRQIVHLAAHTPVHTFYLSACPEVNYAVREQIESLLAYLFSIMPILEHSSGIKVIPYFVKVFNKLMILVAGLKILRHFRKRCRLEHINYEQRVVGGKRPAALGYDVRMVDAVLVGCLDKRIYTVVDVFLD